MLRYADAGLRYAEGFSGTTDGSQTEIPDSRDQQALQPAQLRASTNSVGRDEWRRLVGRLTLVASDQGLVAVLWPNDRPGRVRLDRVSHGRSDHLDRAQDQLDAYFARRLRRFDIPLDCRGTAFQRQVWAELAAIPYGETRSYGAIAAAIGRPRRIAGGRRRQRAATRSRSSCPATAWSAAGGSLTGFAGGLAAKRHLLELESAAGRLL